MLKPLHCDGILVDKIKHTFTYFKPTIGDHTFVMLLFHAHRHPRHSYSQHIHTWALVIAVIGVFHTTTCTLTPYNRSVTTTTSQRPSIEAEMQTTISNAPFSIQPSLWYCGRIAPKHTTISTTAVGYPEDSHCCTIESTFTTCHIYVCICGFTAHTKNLACKYLWAYVTDRFRRERETSDDPKNGIPFPPSACNPLD